MNIAQPLSELLKNNNISRSKLAREIDVHTSTVSNWLDGKDVKPDNLSALCAYFQCSLDFFAQKEKSPVSFDTELQNEFMQLFNKLSVEEQVRELAYLRERIAAQDK